MVKFTSVCPRSGYVRLFDETNLFVGTMPTTCKTWGCKQCQIKLRQYFQMRIQHIVSTAGPCYFITTTLRLVNDTPVTADYANTVLTRFLRLVKSMYPNLYYVKVPELTKKKQPHFHLMIGGISEVKDCCGRKVKGKHLHSQTAENAKVCKYGCLEHWLRELWYGITGDSYRVQADRVYNSAGAGNYLSKYFAKTFNDHMEMWDAGFKTRYSMSRNIPKLERMRLKGTQDLAWGRVERMDVPARIEYKMALDREVKATEVSPRSLLIKVGERYKLKELEAKQAKRYLRMLNANLS